MKKRLFVLLACLFVVMIGFGITLPVLPFFVERLALAEGASSESVALQVGLLTATYPLMQLLFAPVWGRWSDRIGRRPLVIIGVAGYVVAQVLFGLVTSLWLLYAARVLGGILSSAMLPVAAAYVSDVTTEEERGRGMAWLGTALSLGVVVGPALGGTLSRRELHFTARYWHFLIDGFSFPFFAAAFLGLLALIAALRWLPESLPARLARDPNRLGRVERRKLPRSLTPLLVLSLVGQLGLASFEATIPLYARQMFNYGPVEVGMIFVVCGLVMSLFQAGAVGYLTGRVTEIYQIGVGFSLMGGSMLLLAAARTTFVVFSLVGLLALGMALIAPNLSTLISKRGGSHNVGTALGTQNAANSLGQASGPLLGGALFGWWIEAPYVLTGVLLFTVALAIGWNVLSGRAVPPAEEATRFPFRRF